VSRVPKEESVIVEIRAAEGGDDAKVLVERSSSRFISAWALGAVFDLEILVRRSGLVVFRAAGVRAAELFLDEAGGHRWQRVPPNDKRGRVHTSTITVAVLPEPAAAEVIIEEKDLEWSTCYGTGSGGQKRNKTESTVLLTHRPAGIQVRCETARSQTYNRRMAMLMLRARLHEREAQRLHTERAQDRRRQLGSGMRGDKRRFAVRKASWSIT
jgi:peptide chain release factor 1